MPRTGHGRETQKSRGLGTAVTRPGDGRFVPRPSPWGAAPWFGYTKLAYISTTTMHDLRRVSTCRKLRTLTPLCHLPPILFWPLFLFASISRNCFYAWYPPTLTNVPPHLPTPCKRSQSPTCYDHPPIHFHDYHARLATLLRTP